MSRTMVRSEPRKFRWEMRDGEVKRVRAEEMHHEAFNDFVKILELGAEKQLPPLTRKQRALLKSRNAELAKRKRRKSRRDDDDESSTSSQRSDWRFPRTEASIRRRRARLRKKVTNEVRKCGNTVRLMKSFPPVFNEQCNGLSTGVKTLGDLFRDATSTCSDLERKIMAKRAKVAEMDRQYKQIKKRRTRLLFDKLACKASRILDRRQRHKEREAREEAEERNRERSRSRNGRFRDEMTQDDILELMAESEPHAHTALLINDFLDAAAPSRAKVQIENKLAIGDVVNSFLSTENVVASTAKDIINTGVQEFFRSKAKGKLLGAGGDNLFDKQFGGDFTPDDEFQIGNQSVRGDDLTEADVSDMKPEVVTKYYAWQRWMNKERELEIAMQMADMDALTSTAVSDFNNATKDETPLSDDETEIFNTLMDW